MTSTIYTPGVNPGVSLYNLWLTLLSAQDVIDVGRLHHYGSDARNLGAWNRQAYPRVSYGSKHTGIGVWGFDAQQRPVLHYGGWYSPDRGIYSYLALTADGHFRLIHPHGDNHNRLERHTFLSYGHYGGQYIWAVNLSHAPSQLIDPKDWRTRQPYLRERVIKQYWNTVGDRWLYLDERLDGQWSILPVNHGTQFGQAVLADRERTERAYRKWERKDTGRTHVLSVQDGKTTLTSNDAVLRIAALLDVSQPAKAVPMSKTQREVKV